MLRDNLSNENFRKRTQQYQLSCMSLNRDNSEHPEIPTYVPATYSDRVPLHVEWRMRKADYEEEKLTALRQEMRQRSASTLAGAGEDTTDLLQRGNILGSHNRRRGSSYSITSGGTLGGVGNVSGGGPGTNQHLTAPGTNGLGFGGGPLDPISAHSNRPVSPGGVSIVSSGTGSHRGGGRRASVSSSKSASNWLKKKVLTKEQRLEAKQRQSLEAQLEALEVPKPTLAELLREQREMSNEAETIEISRKVFETQYLRVLDQTEDLSGGAMENYLAEARRITQSALYEEVEVDVSDSEEPDSGIIPPLHYKNINRPSSATSSTADQSGMFSISTGAGSRYPGGLLSRSTLSGSGGGVDAVPIVSFVNQPRGTGGGGGAGGGGGGSSLLHVLTPIETALNNGARGEEGGIKGLTQLEKMAVASLGDEDSSIVAPSGAKKRRSVTVRRLRTSLENSRALDFNELMSRSNSNYNSKRDIE